MSTTHQLPANLLDDRNYGTIVKARFKIIGQSGTWTLGFSPEGQPARKEYQGPLHEELFGWMNHEPIIIDAHPVPDQRPCLTIELGDIIIVEGHGTFRLARCTARYQNPVMLEVVESIAR